MEAQSISFPHILKRMHPGLWIPLAGFLGFAALLFFQPLSLFLCSLLFFSLSAHIFGARVTMFGAPALMLGLGFGVSALGKAAFRQLFAHRAALLALLSVLSLALCVPYYHLLRSLAPTPVLGTAHARALLALQGLSPPDSVIWTWWDWGYATNYYTRRVPVADGGNHLGQQLFTLGLVLSTHSPRQANQLIRFSAQEHYRPWEALNQLGPEGAARFLTSLKTTPLPLGTGAKQYLVVTTENFALAPWIEFYGTWDFVRKDGQHARVMRIAPPYQVDYRTGRITKGKHGKQLSLRTIDVLGPNGTKHFQFPKNKVDYNLVLCPGSEESYIVNNLTYGSMMMRLLIDPASPDIAPFFRLAYDGGSTVKIFEVLAPSSGECTSKATGKDTRLYATYSHR